MKTINTAKKILMIIGIGSLIGSFFFYKNTTEFMETAILTKGTVIELLEEYSSKTSSSSDQTVTYRPVILFFDNAGNKVIHTSSTSSTPPLIMLVKMRNSL